MAWARLPFVALFSVLIVEAPDKLDTQGWMPVLVIPVLLTEETSK